MIVASRCLRCHDMFAIFGTCAYGLYGASIWECSLTPNRHEFLGVSPGGLVLSGIGRGDSGLRGIWNVVLLFEPAFPNGCYNEPRDHLQLFDALPPIEEVDSAYFQQAVGENRARR